MGVTKEILRGEGLHRARPQPATWGHLQWGSDSPSLSPVPPAALQVQQPTNLGTIGDRQRFPATRNCTREGAGKEKELWIGGCWFVESAGGWKQCHEEIGLHGKRNPIPEDRND